MQKFSKTVLAKITAEVTRGMTEAGFTGIVIGRQDMPQATLDAFFAEDRDDLPPDVTEFSLEIAYHRVKTDQAEFGFWLLPYPMLDLCGTGLDIGAFHAADQAGLDKGLAQAGLPSAAIEFPAGWMFVTMHEDVFKELFAELAKKNGQP